MVNSRGTSSARDLCSQFLLKQLEEIPELANGTGDHEDMIIETMLTEDNEMFVFGGFAIPRGKSLCGMPKILQHVVFQHVLGLASVIKSVWTAVIYFLYYK